MHHGWASIARLCDALAPAVQIEAGISNTRQGQASKDEVIGLAVACVAAGADEAGLPPGG